MTNKESAKKWFAHIDAKDIAAMRALAGAGHQFHNPMTPVPVGTEEHMGMIQMMTSALKGEHHLDILVTEGEYVAVRGHWKGHHVGEFNGVPATGKAVQFTFTDILRFENGKLTDEYLEMNPMAIMAQIGDGK